MEQLVSRRCHVSVNFEDGQWWVEINPALSSRYYVLPINEKNGQYLSKFLLEHPEFYPYEKKKKS